MEGITVKAQHLHKGHANYHDYQPCTPPGVLPTAALLSGSHHMHHGDSGDAGYDSRCECLGTCQNGHTVDPFAGAAGLTDAAACHTSDSLQLEDGVWGSQGNAPGAPGARGGGHRAFVQAAWFGILVLLCYAIGGMGTELSASLVKADAGGTVAWHAALPLAVKGKPGFLHEHKIKMLDKQA